MPSPGPPSSAAAPGISGVELSTFLNLLSSSREQCDSLQQEVARSGGLNLNHLLDPIAGQDWKLKFLFSLPINAATSANLIATNLVLQASPVSYICLYCMIYLSAN